MGVEQLSFLSFPGDWIGADEISGVTIGDQGSSGREVWSGEGYEPPTHSQRTRMSGRTAGTIHADSAALTFPVLRITSVRPSKAVRLPTSRRIFKGTRTAVQWPVQVDSFQWVSCSPQCWL